MVKRRRGSRLAPRSSGPRRHTRFETLVDRGALRALEAMYPDALGAPRQRARFLCGLTSPATSRAKLTRGPLFGVLGAKRFADVLRWSEN